MRGVLSGVVILIAMLLPVLTFPSTEIWTSFWGAVVVAGALLGGIAIIGRIGGSA